MPPYHVSPPVGVVGNRIRAICLAFGASIIISGCAGTEPPRYSVQLGVFSAEDRATNRVNSEPVDGTGLFRQVSHYTSAEGKDLWRALIDGFESEDAAKAYCLELRLRNVECLWRKSASSGQTSPTVGPALNNSERAEGNKSENTDEYSSTYIEAIREFFSSIKERGQNIAKVPDPTALDALIIGRTTKNEAFAALGKGQISSVGSTAVSYVYRGDEHYEKHEIPYTRSRTVNIDFDYNNVLVDKLDTSYSFANLGCGEKQHDITDLRGTSVDGLLYRKEGKNILLYAPVNKYEVPPNDGKCVGRAEVTVSAPDADNGTIKMRGEVRAYRVFRANIRHGIRLYCMATDKIIRISISKTGAVHPVRPNHSPARCPDEPPEIYYR